MNKNFYSIISGILMGFGAGLLKIFLDSLQLEAAIFGSALGLLGWGIFQYALKNEKAHKVASMSAGASIVASLVVGVLFLKESLSSFEIAGIALITIGMYFYSSQSHQIVN